MSDATTPVVSAQPRSTASKVEAIVAANADDLLQYFLRRVGTPEDAADHVGEVLLALWRKAGAAPADATEGRMWLFGIARRALLEQHRRDQHRSALTARLRLEVRETRTIEQRVDEHADVARALGILSEKDRELVRLHHWEGFSLTEAASILGMHAGTARTRYARARTKLRGTLS